VNQKPNHLKQSQEFCFLFPTTKGLYHHYGGDMTLQLLYNRGVSYLVPMFKTTF